MGISGGTGVHEKAGVGPGGLTGELVPFWMLVDVGSQSLDGMVGIEVCNRSCWGCRTPGIHWLLEGILGQ